MYDAAMDQAALIAAAPPRSADRRRRKRGPAESLEALEEDSPAGDGVHAEAAFFSTNEGPEASAERAEVTRAIERCLHRLPDEFRTVVILADVLALDYAEVAGAMGSPIGTVRSRLARARARLRECLEASRELSRWEGGLPGGGA